MLQDCTIEWDIAIGRSKKYMNFVPPPIFRLWQSPFMAKVVKLGDKTIKDLNWKKNLNICQWSSKDHIKFDVYSQGMNYDCHTSLFYSLWRCFDRFTTNCHFMQK